ncbi:MarR family winged helix-turn-helix transcriptional regulator [Halomonas piscis]|uniref:MarR family winged helix-turn-helix transcriptional regulator n=1 Tax=Halomonas piscis TaxID=3031727 RepID=UPI00289FBDB8|nr:MarR family winged helix-turn-helix transcriptional regulator [Halomonas piscis]
MSTAAQFQPSGNAVKEAAFHEHRRSGGMARTRAAVLDRLAKSGLATRNDLSDALGMPLPSVCGRCRELYDMGYIEPVGTVRADGGHARQQLDLTAEGAAVLAQIAQAAKQEAGHAE